MPFTTSRRTFLRDLARTGATLPLATHLVAQAPTGESPAVQLENDLFNLAFDTRSGRLTIRRHGGAALLLGAVACANTGTGRRLTSEAAYWHAVEAVSQRDLLGEGRQLVVRSTDGERRLDFELRVTLYAGQPVVLIEAACRNVSAQTIIVESLEPVRAVHEQEGALLWPDTTKLLTNGAMYYDPGVITDFARPDSKTLRSWWNVGLFRGYGGEGLACGYLDNQAALGQVTARREGGAAISLTAESVLAKGFELRPGQTVGSGRFMLNIAPTPYAALETYADFMGRLHAARTSSVLNGWCNWFFTYEHITEEEILRNAAFAARTLKPLGLDYIQVDEGYQRWHGEWEGNDRFPHGMKWLADRIRALGLKPGIWIAPYVISEPSEVFQEHPNWLIRHPDGRLKRVGPWPSEDSDWAKNEKPKRYGLDITHPGAAAWLADLFETVGRRWGYEMIKIDFVDWSLLSAHRYYDPTVSRAAAYRRGFEILRRSVGPDCHLQECGPAPVTVGLVDSMRIELDQNYGYRSRAWQQYVGETTSSAAAAAKRYYFHKRTWINDADHVCLNLLSLPQAQAAATLIALTGGNVLSGDRLPDLDASRLEILKKIYPASGDAARPVNLFDTDRQAVFVVKLRRAWGAWTVVGVFNPSETDIAACALPLERLWLDPAKTWLAYDFWKECLHGEVMRELKVTVLPASVTLLALHEQRGVPQVISTDRHVMQGTVELESVVWNAETETLSGVSLGPIGTAHHVAVYVPEAHPWRQGGHALFHDHPDFTIRMVEDHVLRVRVRFDQAARVAWKIPLGDFFRKS